MTPLERLGPRVEAGEYPFHPISAGIPEAHRSLVHVVNFNDVDSVRRVCEKYPTAAMLTEPILQNVGLIKPQEGYLQGLRALADEHGFLLIFDEIKTGFRHAFGGYAEVCGVRPDLAVYGKAIASGYPLAAIAGPARLMDYFYHPDPVKRVLLAGTYNAHPLPTAAAIATLKTLLEGGGREYKRVERLGAKVEAGLKRTLAENCVTATVVRQGSAFVVYFMDHPPVDWHDLAANHDFELDTNFRRSMIAQGVYFFPVATKQCSLSLAHTDADVEQTLEVAASALKGVTK
jgi:glutamate-1-semialdehyde 2,1-aminomutase